MAAFPRGRAAVAQASGESAAWGRPHHSPPPPEEEGRAPGEDDTVAPLDQVRLVDYIGRCGRCERHGALFKA